MKRDPLTTTRPRNERDHLRYWLLHELCQCRARERVNGINVTKERRAFRMQLVEARALPFVFHPRPEKAN